MDVVVWKNNMICNRSQTYNQKPVGYVLATTNDSIQKYEMAGGKMSPKLTKQQT
jgi:hypothetical protein